MACYGGSAASTGFTMPDSGSPRCEQTPPEMCSHWMRPSPCPLKTPPLVWAAHTRGRERGAVECAEGAKALESDASKHLPIRIYRYTDRYVDTWMESSRDWGKKKLTHLSSRSRLLPTMMITMSSRVFRRASSIHSCTATKESRLHYYHTKKWVRFSRSART